MSPSLFSLAPCSYTLAVDSLTVVAIVIFRTIIGIPFIVLDRVNPLGHEIEGPILEMELTHTPIEESIKVFVDGQVYDNSLWYYEASINSVIFTERDSAGELIGPPPSSLVEVGYVYEELESTDTGDTGDTGS